MILFWLKRLPRRLHFIMTYQTLHPKFILVSEQKTSSQFEKVEFFVYFKTHTGSFFGGGTDLPVGVKTWA